VRADIITIFPEYFSPLGVSLIGKAAARGDIEFHVHDLRQWTNDVHRTVDDAPYGGGPGMVMKPGPWGDALDVIIPEAGTGTAGEQAPRLVVPTPSGVLFTQDRAAGYAREHHLVFACGRYEGIDARVVAEARSRMPVDEVSIGDYVLAGGEPAVLVMIEAICRLLPGVLGNAHSVSDDSFGAGTPGVLKGRSHETGAAGGVGGVSPQVSAAGGVGGREASPSQAGAATGGRGMAGLLEGPVYTRPRVWRGREVPPVLSSGDHAAIARWRRDEALRRTAANRPDLVARLAAGGEGTEGGGQAVGTGTDLDARDRQVLADAGFTFSVPDPAS